MAEDNAYQSVIRAVHGRWRRRFFALAHLAIAAIALTQVWEVYFRVYTYTDRFGAQQQGSTEQWIYGVQHPVGIVWMGLIAAHLLYALIAEFRDRAVQRAVERERKWRLLERMDVEQPIMRERALRLMQTRDGELVEFDEQAWETNVKAKRG
jgi:hypothetical protein